MADDFQLERHFTAHEIEKKSIRIRWTENLVDHLLLTDDDGKKELAVFHQASVLSYHRRIEIRRRVFKDDLIQETLNTLALLMPKYDARTAPWFERKRRKSTAFIDPEAAMHQISDQCRNTMMYPYWKDRLLILKQELDNTQPQTL
ncbi:hypothetical protein B0A49_10545 [Cryomyces minteri]|uniref:Uncharacterized protein n=1 Tax=Cryomyces minteri TaxID=331657 RepID=A0A4U0WS06_9PEZI|nr:hypothetical protein B0A49_10545 [Cryomyces minteri]